MKALNANLLLTPPVSSSSSCSEEEPEGTLPKDKLITLCKYEPILKWMRSCDHILYQALVEILIPDVLRPVPSEYPQPTVPGHLSLISLWPPLGTEISTVKTNLEVFVVARILWQQQCSSCSIALGRYLVPPGNSHAF